MKGRLLLRAIWIVICVAIISGVIVYFTASKTIGLILVAAGFLPDLCWQIVELIKDKNKKAIYTAFFDVALIGCMMFLALTDFIK